MLKKAKDTIMRRYIQPPDCRKRKRPRASMNDSNLNRVAWICVTGIEFAAILWVWSEKARIFAKTENCQSEQRLLRRARRFSHFPS